MRQVTLKSSILIGVVCIPFLASGQIEPMDSISFVGQRMDSQDLQAPHVVRIGNQAWSYGYPSIGSVPTKDTLNLRGMVRPLQLTVPDLILPTQQPSLHSWRGGELIAMGRRAVMPGLMQIESGSVGVYQQIGNFSMYAGGIANKYGYFRGVHTQYGLNGNISYGFSPKLSLTAFATYYFGRTPEMGGGLPMPPSMAGYFGVTRFGGYMDYQPSERFGVEMGAQCVKQIVTNRFEMEPIVTPYIKVGNGKKKFKIGLPVGQILHGILRQNHYRSMDINNMRPSDRRHNR